MLLQTGLICYSLDCFTCVDCILLRVSYLVIIDKDKVTATLYTNRLPSVAESFDDKEKECVSDLYYPPPG